VAVAERNGMSPASAAIAWVRAKPWITAPIIGANRVEQLRDTMAGLDTPLPPEDLAELDEVSDFHRPRPDREV
jgi:aryl-alcohol dehydrogenase-like predicted oxidoreductase